jgi:large conductance mechanosensitive channel
MVLGNLGTGSHFSVFAFGTAGVAANRSNHPWGIAVRGLKTLSGFRDFITRGNLIDLAVAVVIGTAFTAIVTAIVADLITPLIGAIWGNPSFAAWSFQIHHSTFKIGALLNAILTFVIIAAVVYFLIVAPMARIVSRFTHAAAITTRDCPECLSSIPLAATRCSYCTVEVPPVGSSIDTSTPATSGSASTSVTS